MIGEPWDGDMPGAERVSHEFGLEAGRKSSMGSKKIIGMDGNPPRKGLTLSRLYTDRLQVTDFIGDEDTSLPAAYHLITS